MTEEIIPIHIPDNPDSPELIARKQSLHARSKMMRGSFHEAMRLYDLIYIQAMQKFGGNHPLEVTASHPEMQPWGIWIRDMKRAIDASNGNPPPLLPLPPLPSWFETNPGIDGLCDRLGIKA